MRLSILLHDLLSHRSKIMGIGLLLMPCYWLSTLLLSALLAPMGRFLLRRLGRYVLLAYHLL